MKHNFDGWISIFSTVFYMYNFEIQLSPPIKLIGEFDTYKCYILLLSCGITSKHHLVKFLENAGKVRVFLRIIYRFKIGSIAEALFKSYFIKEIVHLMGIEFLLGLYKPRRYLMGRRTAKNDHFTTKSYLVKVSKNEANNSLGVNTQHLRW